MPATPQHEFREFALEQISNGDAELSLEELVDMWRILYPEPRELENDVLAVEAAIRDMEHGDTGRPIQEFHQECRQRNQL